MRLLKIIAVGVFVLMFTSINAQEGVHFSQFSDATTMFNPANVGVFHGSLRFNGHYRTQWGKAGQPYKTIGGAVDAPVLSDVTGSDFFAVGAYAISDEAGLSETKNMYSGLNLAFGKSFDPDETHFFSMGFKMTYNQKSTNNHNDLKWGSQWDVLDGTGWIDGNAGMPVQEYSMNYVGFGAGFHHFYTNHEYVRGAWGISINNINRPTVNFLNTEYQLNTSIYWHGEVEIHSHADNFAIIPRAAAYFQGPQRYFIFGSSFDFLLKEAGKMTGIVKEATLEFGAFYRVRDAIVFEVQANWAGIGLGFSYDQPVSPSGKAVNYVGAMEVLLHYKLGYKTGIQSKHDNHRFDSIH